MHCPRVPSWPPPAPAPAAVPPPAHHAPPHPALPWRARLLCTRAHAACIVEEGKAIVQKGASGFSCTCSPPNAGEGCTHAAKQHETASMHMAPPFRFGHSHVLLCCAVCLQPLCCLGSCSRLLLCTALCQLSINVLALGVCAWHVCGGMQSDDQSDGCGSSTARAGIVTSRCRAHPSPTNGLLVGLAPQQLACLCALTLQRVQLRPLARGLGHAWQWWGCKPRSGTNIQVR